MAGRLLSTRVDPENRAGLSTTLGDGRPNSDDFAFAGRPLRETDAAVVPGSSFFRDKESGRSFVRFCFCKRDETLDEAARRLRSLRALA